MRLISRLFEFLAWAGVGLWHGLGEFGQWINNSPVWPALAHLAPHVVVRDTAGGGAVGGDQFSHPDIISRPEPI
ncbi:hypothetical protein ACWC5I_47940, partial [Kitasatospora sp. NPDC001574]